MSEFTFVGRVLEWFHRKTGLHPLLISFLVFGVLGSACVFAGVLVVLGRLYEVVEIVKRNWVEAYVGILAYTWVWYGPYLIYKFERDYFPSFWERVLRRWEGDGWALAFFMSLKERYYESYLREYYRFSVPLVLLALVDAAFMCDYAVKFFGAKALLDPWYVVAVAEMTVIVFLGGIGFNGVYTVVRVIKELREHFRGREDVLVDPLHEDGFGGLMAFGEIAIKATLLFASGSVLLPFLLDISHWLGGITFVLGIISAGIFVFFVLLVFLYPTLLLHDIARRGKELHLSGLMREYRRILSAYFSEGKVTEDNLRSLEVINDCIDKVRSMKEYPLDSMIIAQLATSLIFPIVVSALQVYIELYLRG